MAEASSLLGESHYLPLKRGRRLYAGTTLSAVFTSEKRMQTPLCPSQIQMVKSTLLPLGVLCLTLKHQLDRGQLSCTTCSVFSPFEEMDPPVSLQHSESKRSKSQKCRVARDVLRSTNSRVVSHSRVAFFKTTQASYLCSEEMTNSFLLAQ